jgi:hypothetical protein
MLKFSCFYVKICTDVASHSKSLIKHCTNYKIDFHFMKKNVNMTYFEGGNIYIYIQKFIL